LLSVTACELRDCPQELPRCLFWDRFSDRALQDKPPEAFRTTIEAVLGRIALQSARETRARDACRSRVGRCGAANSQAMSALQTADAILFDDSVS
jgi:hypothetical protein